jgi:hypothetical protein
MHADHRERSKSPHHEVEHEEGEGDLNEDGKVGKFDQDHGIGVDQPVQVRPRQRRLNSPHVIQRRPVLARLALHFEQAEAMYNTDLEEGSQDGTVMHHGGHPPARLLPVSGLVTGHLPRQPGRASSDQWAKSG